MEWKNYRINIELTDSEELLFKEFMKKEGISNRAEACRKLMTLGIGNDFSDEQMNLILKTVTSVVEEKFSYSDKRLKSILLKALKQSMTSTYFILGIFRDMIHGEFKKNFLTLYEDSSKFAHKELKKKGL